MPVDPEIVTRLAAVGVRVRPLEWSLDTTSGRNGQWVKNEAEAIEADHINRVLSLLEIIPDGDR